MMLVNIKNKTPRPKHMQGKKKFMKKGSFIFKKKGKQWWQGACQSTRQKRVTKNGIKPSNRIKHYPYHKKGSALTLPLLTTTKDIAGMKM